MKATVLVLMMAMAFGVTVSAQTIGAAGAAADRTLTLPEMLQYAIEDEHLALAEYEAIMQEFGVVRPFSNIAETEKAHIGWLEDLYVKYKLAVPNVNTSGHTMVPESLFAAAEIGVEAEQVNIAMYEKFLQEQLPADVRAVFEQLKRSSENHLQSFERQVAAGESTARRGRSGF